VRIDSIGREGYPYAMSRLKWAAKIVLLGALAFGLAAGIGATALPNSYALSLAVSVALCPALLGFIGARSLSLGAAATLTGINLLPVLMALDQRFHLGEPTGFGWLAASFVFAWAGWKLGKWSRPG
jgi:hypothetical protein